MVKDAIMNVLHKGSTTEGTIQINGTIRIDGKLKGRVETTEKIVIGETGVIDGDLKAKEVNLSGKCKGTITAENLVVLHSSAIFDGDIKCKKLVVEEGVILDGNINMKEKDKNAQELQKKERNQAHQYPDQLS